MWSRLYLAPLLQAEEDRDQVRRYYADKAREKELLGTEEKVYNSDRCVFPISEAICLIYYFMLILACAQLHPPHFRLYPFQGYSISRSIEYLALLCCISDVLSVLAEGWSCTC